MGTRALLIMLLLAVSAWPSGLARAEHAPPPPREPEAIRAMLAQAPRASTERPLEIVLLAGPKDHGPREHAYPLWQKRWKVLLGGTQPSDEPVVSLFGPAQPVDRKDLAGAENVRVTTAWVWPSAEQWNTADLIVMFSAPPWDDAKLAQLKTYLERGGGFVIIHMPVWHASPVLLSLVGTAYQDGSQYRHGPVALRLAGRHPICLGLPQQIDVVDESYFNLRLDVADGDVVATSRETRSGEALPRDEPMLWARPYGKGRVFICIPGHYSWTFDDPLFRILLLRGMAWAAGESPYRFDPLVLRGARIVRPIEPQAPSANDPELLLWLDASDKTSLVIDEGNRVAQWRNKAQRTGRAVTATGDERPRWVAGAIGKSPAVRFDGQDDVLRDNEFSASADRWTLFLVVAPRSNRGSGIPHGFHGFFSANALGKQDFTSGMNVGMGGLETDCFACLNVEGSKGGGVCNLLQDPSAFGEPRVLAIATDHELTTLYADAAAQGVRGASDAVTSLAQIRVGARCYLDGRETGFVDADVAEVILYRQCLPADRIAAVSAYLQKKYAIRSAAVPLSLEDAVAALATYDWAKSRRRLGPIDDVIRQADPAGRTDLEGRLVAALEGNLPPAGSDFVCRRLARIGTARSVPAVARLLTDKDRGAMARYALARIPADEAAAALLASLPETTGPARLEVIAALGRRRYRPAIGTLLAILREADKPEAQAALAALAQIGVPEAVEPALARADAPADVLLTLAERLGINGHKDAARTIYERFDDSPVPCLRAAALGGLVTLAPRKAAERLLEALVGDDVRLRGQAVWLLAYAADETAATIVVGKWDNLPPVVQLSLLGADWARHPSVGRQCAIQGAGSMSPDVRRAAAGLLKDVGRAEDVGLLARMASDPRPEVQEAARSALRYLEAEGVRGAILDQLAESDANVLQRLAILRAAAERRMREAVPALVKLAESSDAATRVAALDALGTLGNPSTVAALVPRLLAAGEPGERAAAERAVWRCSLRIEDPERRAAPLLAAIERAGPADRAGLLPVLGRLGGRRALDVVHQARTSPDAAVRDAAVQALANWPDATVADELLDLAQNAESDSQKIRALRGYIRVVTLRGVRSDAETLAMLRRGLPLATRVEEKRLILARLPAVVVPESLALALSYLDDEHLRNDAAAAAARLAELLVAEHPDAAAAAMERVLAVTTDPKLRARLQRQLKKR